MGAIQPTKNHKLIIDEFISYAQQHLSTVSGIVNTVSTYPPLNTPGPGIVNWSGYSVQKGLDDLNEDEREADAIRQDIEEEYPANQAIYEAEFATEEEAMENNSNITEEEAFFSVKKYNVAVGKVDEVTDAQVITDTAPPVAFTGSFNPPELDSPQGNQGGSSQVTRGPVARGDLALFKLCGNGIWPALGSAPNFEVRTVEPGKCDRYWYKVNKEYMIKNCTEIMFPTATGDKKILVHKNLAAIVKPAIAQIKAAGLQKYIENCGGGLAVRNVTCGARLSNHSWGTAIDMNTIKYGYGTSFKSDGIYKGKTKVRDLDEFDRGFLRVASIFRAQGMTWLSTNDPMHVSIYE